MGNTSLTDTKYRMCAKSSTCLCRSNSSRANCRISSRVFDCGMSVIARAMSRHRARTFCRWRNLDRGVSCYIWVLHNGPHDVLAARMRDDTRRAYAADLSTKRCSHGLNSALCLATCSVAIAQLRIGAPTTLFCNTLLPSIRLT